MYIYVHTHTRCSKNQNSKHQDKIGIFDPKFLPCKESFISLLDMNSDEDHGVTEEHFNRSHPEQRTPRLAEVRQQRPKHHSEILEQF